jgi:hypothetical protein
LFNLGATPILGASCPESEYVRYPVEEGGEVGAADLRGGEEGGEYLRPLLLKRLDVRLAGEAILQGSRSGGG